MKTPNRIFALIAVLVMLTLALGRFVVGLYTESLWFGHTGFGNVFWTRFWTATSVKAAAAVLAGTIILVNLWIVTRQLAPVHVRRRYGNLEISEQVPRKLVTVGVLLASALAGWWLADIKFGRGMALNVLLWLKRTAWGVTDPLFNKDISFYAFTLPVYNQLIELLMLATFWALALSVMTYALVGTIRFVEQRLEVDPKARTHGLILFATLLVLLGVRMWIGRYGVLFNGTGFNNSIGYTDVHARLPAQRIIALLCILTGGALSYSALVKTFRPALIALAMLFIASVGGGILYPSFIQKFRVDPNEFRFEQEYIKWNIDFTRRAYGLTNVNRQPYVYERNEAEPAELSRRLEDVPVWDVEPLHTAYNQLQAFFPYYHFPNVDYDRYRTPSGSRQVAIAVREFQPSGLQENARTWLNLHFDPKYIRGLGAVVTPAAEMGRGAPPTWVSNVNPIERRADAPAELNLAEPSIFFGETMDRYAVIKKNTGLVAPKTAIPLSNMLRVVAFSARFRDKNLLFTGDLTDGSDIVFRRRIGERVRAIAPFIVWDPDPYPVISSGRVVWIMDGYSATTMFPAARRMEIADVGGVRYFQNTVKATIDAATGETTLYRFGAADPLLATYANAFPGMFTDMTQMPADLREHIRYPLLYLHEQAEMYGHYHLDNPDAFYRAEDVWQMPQTGDATGASNTAFRAVYQMMTLPGEERDEFVLAAPYIARQRQNMTALMVARNDGDHYGELMMLELPRNQLIPGPVQVHAIVEQDPTISQQLSLWRQAGSDVNIGHVRVVPIASGILYVMPLFLSAQGSPIPELQRVIVSDGARVAMANTLRDAFTSLFGTASAAVGRDTTATPTPPVTGVTPTAEWPKRALDLLDQAERSLRAGDYAGFGTKMAELKRFLQTAKP